VRADHPSIVQPALPDPTTPPAASEPADTGPNRATRRGKRGSVPAPAHARGAAPHARGVQGRRINPVRRTG
jgi:hypothetical protein